LAGHRNIRAVLGGTTNAEAQDLVLQVSAGSGNDSSEAFLRRIALLDRAIRLDPNYADAWARKGTQESLWANAFARNMAERNRVEGEAMQSVNRAIAIAPEMSSGHSTLGLILRNQLAMRRSLGELYKAVELPGADSFSFLNYALVLTAFRRQGEAQSAIDRGLSLDPLNPALRMGQAWVLFLGRQYPAAIEAAQATLAIAPENNRARGLLSSSLLLLGRTADAQREVARLPADDYRRNIAEAAIAGQAGRKAEALAAMQRMEQRYGDAVTYQKAQIYAQVGMVDDAIAQLELAWTLRDSGLGGVQVDPFIDPLRKDPRLAAIVKRLFS
jgi:tetratricopeptide (TPR) repeat protein